MKYHTHILKEKQNINQKLKEIDERILILKKSIEIDRRKTKMGKTKKTSMSIPSIPFSAPKKISKSYSTPYANKNRKLLDNLSSGYNTKTARNDDNYQRNKALILVSVVLLVVFWIIYNLTH
jgi:subtilase family serine protease